MYPSSVLWRRTSQDHGDSARARILNARYHDRDRHCVPGLRLVDSLASARRPPSEAAREQDETIWRILYDFIAVALVFHWLQLAFRKACRRLRIFDRTSRASWTYCIARVRRTHLLRLQPFANDADRSYSAARSRLSHRRFSAATRRIARPHRQSAAPCRRHHFAAARGFTRRAVRGIRRRDLHERTQHGRYFRSAETVRGARQGEFDVSKNCGRPPSTTGWTE